MADQLLTGVKFVSRAEALILFWGAGGQENFSPIANNVASNHMIVLITTHTAAADLQQLSRLHESSALPLL